ncbi:phage tail protein [Heliobacterium gestii]|uniref:Phage tail protein n=1 Tax=Heliomicrobium gestii TaxID=2699 RepID=A0A845LFG9_HELGE|nr:phage tail protein [Heliomicrobium gestii]MBM7868045.1 phage tail-like protein [Heliomicrobium gestii]MZP44311.1 phage tail protein [Heliomicrobium gestii]
MSSERPVASFRFLLEIAKPGEKSEIAGGFSEVSGLESSIEFEEYHEGGVNDFVHIFPKKPKFVPLVLKRGLSQTSTLWDWYAEVRDGKIVRKSGSILLLNDDKTVLAKWDFSNAYPVRWGGPVLKANQSEIAVESIELVHTGLKLAIKNN